MIVSKNSRCDDLGAVVIGAVGEDHRLSNRTRMSGFAGSWYGVALPVATPPAIRPSGAESRS